MDEENEVFSDLPLVIVVGTPRYSYIVAGTRISAEINLNFGGTNGAQGESDGDGVVKGMTQHVTK